MSDEQNQTDALEALRSALAESSDALLDILAKEREDRVADARLPVSSGLRLAYELGRLTDDQRKALLLGAELTEQQRKSVVKLLTPLSGKWPHDA